MSGSERRSAAGPPADRMPSPAAAASGTDDDTGAAGLPWTLPGWSVRAAFVVVAVPLALTAAPSGPWPALCVVLAGLAVAVPRWRVAWLLIAVLALSALLEDAAGVSPRVLALVAGALALHLLAAWMLVVPARARIQPAVLLPGLWRYVAIQLPVQAAAVVLLAVRQPVPGGGAAIVAGLAVLALATLLTLLVLRRPGP